MLLPSLSSVGKSSGGADECLAKVKEAERSLQQSLHVAREALVTLAGQTPPPEKAQASPAPAAAAEGQQPGKDGQPARNAIPDKGKAQMMFNSVDKDGSGKVSVQELRKLMDEMRDDPLTDKEFDDLKMKLVKNDNDSDGLLSFEEFYKAFYLATPKKEDKRAKARELQKDALQASQQQHMSPEQFVQIRGVAQSAVTRYLRKELDETSACLQLPWAALIFLFFFFAVRTHFDLDRLHAVDQAITFDIKENANFAFTGIIPFQNGRMGHKNIEDVNSIADFWSFLNMGIVPIFWMTGWDVNEARLNTLAYCSGAKANLQGWGGYSSYDNLTGSDWAPVPGTCPERANLEVAFPEDTKKFFGLGGQSSVQMDGTYLLFHRILAGVRMRQERVPLIRCPDRIMTQKVGMCTDKAAYWLKPEIQRSLEMDPALVNQPGGETVHFLNGKSQDKIRDELRVLENEAWFSPQTRKIELLFTTYNVNEDMLTATYILFFLNRGGHIFKNVEPVSFYLDPYHGLWRSYFFDIAWASLCLKLLLEETWEIVKHWRQLGMGKGTFVYMNNLANAIDWISIAFTVGLIIFCMSHLSHLSDIKAVIRTADWSLQGSWQTDSERDHFFDMVHQAVHETHTLRTALALYPFVIVSRFFKAFSSQPRLAMVTKTFAKASVDIFHFGVVFLTVFTIFAVSAMILWGQELEEFANESRSFHTSFRILLGDFDWEPLTTVGRIYAYVWFWSFVWLVNLIMFNMLLAIIMDVYTDVKSGSADAETLWSQSVEIFYRTRDVFSGKTVSLSRVLEALDPTDLDATDENENEDEDDTPLFPANLAAKVPKMSEDQSFHILLEAQKLKMSDEQESNTMSEALVKIQDIDDRTKLIQEHIVRLIQVQQYSTGQDAGVVHRPQLL